MLTFFPPCIFFPLYFTPTLNTRGQPAFQGHVTHAAKVLWELSFGKMFQFAWEAWADSGCHGENEHSSSQRWGSIDFNFNRGHSANTRLADMFKEVRAWSRFSFFYLREEWISVRVTTSWDSIPADYGRLTFMVPKQPLRFIAGITTMLNSFTASPTLSQDDRSADF